MSELKNLEDHMVITGIILIVEGYFFTNILPSLIGFSIILYMVGVGLSISYKKITISIDKEDIELYNNKDDVVNIPVIIENNNGVPILVSIDIDSKLVSMSVDINSNDANNNGNNNTNNNINDNNNDNNKKTILINGNEKKKFSLIFSPKTIGSSTNKIIFNIFDINKIFMKKIEKTVNIKVIPSVSSVKNYLKYSKNLKIALELLSEIKTGHESIEFNELREYVGGYSEKKIDWKRSAKYNYDKLLVKDYLYEREGIMYILVDVSSNFIRKRGEYILKLVKYITESLKLKKRGYKIIVFNENIFEEVKSEKELGNYIKELEGIPYLGINIKKIGIFDRFRLDNVGGVILITDAGLWYADILDFLKKLSKNGINFYVISLNPFLFLDKDFIEENFDKIYDNFLKREEYIKKLLYLGYVVDLGKNDLLDRVFPKRD